MNPMIVIALTCIILGVGALHLGEVTKVLSLVDQETLGLVLRVLIHFLEILMRPDAKTGVICACLESVVDLRGDLDQEFVVVGHFGTTEN